MTTAARLRSGKQEYTVPLHQLAGRWQGAFATLWSAPPQIRRGDTAEDGDMAGWLRQRFTVIDGTTELVDTATAINKRVAAFQVANGLQPDGIAGPVTLMALNRLSKVREPRLKVER
jgi:general secretion pathway protein A